MSFLTSPGLTSTPATSNQQNVSGYAQPYVNNLLSRTQALANAPMPQYTGQLTAGPSPLQEQAWKGISNLTLPQAFAEAQKNLGQVATKAQNLKYDPLDVTAQQFNTESANQYMNPYLEAALKPQLEEARRQAMISGAGIAAKAAGSGAFGGTRDTLMQSENLRNLGRLQEDITGKGYNTAYQQAMAQFNADQLRDMEAQKAMVQQAQFGSNLGLQGLQAATQASQALSQSGMSQGQLELAQLQLQALAGGQQQGLDQSGLNAQYNQYLSQLQYPQTMVGLQSNILRGLPIQSTSVYGAAPSGLQNTAGLISGLGGLFGDVSKIPGVSSGLGSLFSGVRDWWNSAPVGSGSLDVANSIGGTADYVNAFENAMGAGALPGGVTWL
jgi:hypothetical protein